MEERYEKQINFSGIGEAGQKELLEAKAVVIGCGALGTVVANSLARTGLGTLRIVDRDYVELSNLHRQILFDETHIGMPKAEAARTVLEKVNSTIKIEAIIKDVNSLTIEALVKEMDMIIDCTDNFRTRYLINDVSFQNKIPWIYGAAIGSTGMVKNYIPGITGCLRCMMEVPPPSGSLGTCDTEGVVNTVTGIIAMIEANEAIKYLSGNQSKMLKQMLFFDLWENEFETMELTKNESCSCCGKGEFVFLENKLPEAVHICGNNSVQIDLQESGTKFSLDKLYERLKGSGFDVKLTPYLLRLKVEDKEIRVFDDGRAMIKNVQTIEEAKGIYSKYIGY